MKIKFLGTAAAEGLPALFCDCEACTRAKKLGGKDIRTRSQSVIDDDLLIDFPADTYMHVLSYGLDLGKIKNIIITHSHSDHFYINDILMRLPGFSNFDSCKKLGIFACDKVFNELKQNRYVQKLENLGILTVNEFKPFRTEKVGDYEITPLIANHDSKEICLIYLIQKGAKTLLYAHDTGLFPESTMEYLQKSGHKINFATFDCCYSLGHCQKGHLGFDEVLIMKERLYKSGVLNDKTICCVNHFSHNGAQSYKAMSEHSLKYNILTSYDGMEKEF